MPAPRSSSTAPTLSGTASAASSSTDTSPLRAVGGRSARPLRHRLATVGVSAALVVGGLGLTAPAAAASVPTVAAAAPTTSSTAPTADAVPTAAVAHARALAAARARAARARAAVARRARARAHARAMAASSFGFRAVRLAASRAGSPYVCGAAGPWRFDCSGLVKWVYDHLGRRLPRTAGAQYGATQHVSRHAMRPGDLVFFASYGRIYHVAIYAGGGYIWAAPYPGKRVEREKLWTSDILAGRVR